VIVIVLEPPPGPLPPVLAATMPAAVAPAPAMMAIFHQLQRRPALTAGSPVPVAFVCLISAAPTSLPDFAVTRIVYRPGI
jgi:hypothetical protein